MWVWFDLFCDVETQQRLHKTFAAKIREWKKRDLIRAAVLTYHGRTPPYSLYVCLDIPKVKKPAKRTVQLSRETIEQIPSEIMTPITEVCAQNDVRFEVEDYEFVLIENRASEQYRNAPVEEILRFASIGTRISLEILALEETGEQPWVSNKGKADFIMASLRRELGDDYYWLGEAFHFVCNPLRLNDLVFWHLAHARVFTY